jgi:hypothetical protein
MPCNIFSQRYAIQNLNSSLRALVTAGFGPLTEPYQVLAKLRNDMLSKLGLKIPKSMSLLKVLVGLSPGLVKVWHDSDSGWFTEARAKDGAPPVYHHVTDAVATQILSGKLTHELEAELMKPDEYLGE